MLCPDVVRFVARPKTEVRRVEKTPPTTLTQLRLHTDTPSSTWTSKMPEEATITNPSTPTRIGAIVDV